MSALEDRVQDDIIVITPLDGWSDLITMDNKLM